MTTASSRQIPQFMAIVVALVVAIASALLLSFAEPEAVSPERAPPLSQLPGLPGEAPVLPAPIVPDGDDARARNAAMPFFDGPIAPAAPFRMTSAPSDFARARECLALAAMAEAGPSDVGQRAVLQVILNRVRHPAFAKTVCGVVFEGSQRATGCQFSFTCDGSLARQYSPAAWAAARNRSEQALTGYVFNGVGNATHYHTDWVHPYWSPKLVKIAQVETHLFFRWPGYWGTPQAMRVPYSGGEPDVTQLEAASDPIAPAALPSFAPLPPDTPKVTGGQVAMRDPTGKGNFMLLGGNDPAQALANARKLCGAGGTCRVLGWSDPLAIPVTFPLPKPSRAALQFSYSRDPAGAEIALYNCDFFTGIERDRCIPKAR